MHALNRENQITTYRGVSILQYCIQVESIQASPSVPYSSTNCSVFHRDPAVFPPAVAHMTRSLLANAAGVCLVSGLHIDVQRKVVFRSTAPGR